MNYVCTHYAKNRFVATEYEQSNASAGRTRVCGIPSRKKNVIYRAEANTAMRFAPVLLAALETGFNQSMNLKTVIRQATGFSHGRRIEIAQALNGKSRSFEELKKTLGMSSSALSRHLVKLETRSFIQHNGTLYRRGKPGNPLGKVLIKLASKPHSATEASM